VTGPTGAHRISHAGLSAGFAQHEDSEIGVLFEIVGRHLRIGHGGFSLKSLSCRGFVCRLLLRQRASLSREPAYGYSCRRAVPS
jgi:hypothetical protein